MVSLLAVWNKRGEEKYRQLPEYGTPVFLKRKRNVNQAEKRTTSGCAYTSYLNKIVESAGEGK